MNGQSRNIYPVKFCLLVAMVLFICGMSLVNTIANAQPNNSTAYFKSDVGLRSDTGGGLHQQKILVRSVSDTRSTSQVSPDERSASTDSRNRSAIDLHYIRKTDTKQSIVGRYRHLNANLTWAEIAHFNGLQEPAKPRTGSVVRIPGAIAVTPRSVSSDVTTTQVPQSKQSIVGTPLTNQPIQRDTGETGIRNMTEPATRFRGNSFSQAATLASNMSADYEPRIVVTGSTAIARPESSIDSVDDKVAMNIDMFVGEAKVFGKVAIDRVAIGNGAILRSEVLANGELLTIAQAAGSSTLHLWHKDGSRSDFNVRVSEHDPEFRVKLQKSIRMRVKMIEFRRSALKRLGIDWGDSIDGPVFATAGDLVSNSLFRPDSGALGGNGLPLAVQPFTGYLGITSQLSSRINFLMNNGDAEMLAEPVLSTRNGGSAKFLAGGEVPYPTIGPNGQTNVEFREYGIRLEVSPVADEGGAIQASILTEVSSIDASVEVLGAPGLLTRRTQTQVSVMEGDTIVVAGLLQSESGKDIDSLPGIGKLPIIGKLFRSDNLRNNVSELVIFITPEIVDPSLPALTRQQLDTSRYASQRLSTGAESLREAWRE